MKVSKQLIKDAIDVILRLRDFHDDHCEFCTCCEDSVEADRVTQKLEAVA